MNRLSKPLLPDTMWNLLYPPAKAIMRGAKQDAYTYFRERQAWAFAATPVTPQDILADSWWLAEASLVVYEDDRTMREALEAAGFTMLEIISAGNTQAFLAKLGEAMVVCFRGTEADDPRDLLTDLDIALEPFDGSTTWLAHRGFIRALDRIWKDIAGRISKFGASAIFFTGHSLGAALATLAPLRCTANCPVYLFPFASPCVGNLPLIQAVETKTQGNFYRFVNAQDLVTLVPPGTLYAHGGTEYFIDASGKIQTGWSDQQKWESVVWAMVSHDQPILGPAFDRIIAVLDIRKMWQLWNYFPTLLKLVDTLKDKNNPPLYLLGNHSPARYAVNIANNLQDV